METQQEIPADSASATASKRRLRGFGTFVAFVVALCLAAYVTRRVRTSRFRTTTMTSEDGTE